MATDKSVGKTFVNGIFATNPVFRLAVGLVPALGITHLAINGVYIGMATAVVLLATVLCKVVISRFLPKNIDMFVNFALLIIFTSVLYRLMNIYRPEILVQLGIYFPLIAINSFVLNRLSVELSPGRRIVDAIGMGIGYTLALTIIGIIREFIGLGQFFGMQILEGNLAPFSLAVTVPGALVIVGLLLGLFNALSKEGAVSE